ncbi:iron-containing alcohol dehydrogenase [Halioglobus maricola]|uniref:Iron-containing alcohol dehydrogenase n=1 Tax=Halioglobus maricola TaxID=2601894 RepID=A0A5P9NHS7_9GAMM|nr:iron-containing alcohol dehydrogenase [Halioglobus maricola]QFU75342.1 iron-containing alcohol dehydrogenase [Halioglobus maricola]
MKTLYYKFRAFTVTWLLRLIPRPAPVIFSGAGSANTLAKQFAVLGHSKILIVTDSFLASSGILDGIKATLDENNTRYAIFDGVLPDPAFDQIQAGEALLRTESCDAVLAVGGGSVLDAGKLIALLHTNPGTLDDFDGIQKSKNLAVPIFAVPTTAGTGSEITYVSVISDPDTHAKVPVIDNKLMPGYVALDADIMKGMPPGITAATGMDALTHAVESYIATSSTPATEVQAVAAVKLIFKNLTRAWHKGDDLEARDGMALAAFYAGSAFGRTSVGYVHGIAHQLGRVCHTPHGNANAMVLPEVLSNYGACVHERLAQLARDVNIGSESDDDATLARQFIQAIVDMRAEMELPLKPRGLTQADVPGIVEEAIAEAGSIYPVPRYMSEAEISGIVRGLLEAA